MARKGRRGGREQGSAKASDALAAATAQVAGLVAGTERDEERLAERLASALPSQSRAERSRRRALLIINTKSGPQNDSLGRVLAVASRARALAVPAALIAGGALGGLAVLPALRGAARLNGRP